MTERIAIAGDEALLVVDPQADFCPGGSLAVREGDAVMPMLSRVAKVFARAGRPVLASRDWHPSRTKHFEKWPPHCVQGTPGARFHTDLALPAETRVFSKGAGTEDDGYSAFEGRDEEGRALEEELRARGVRRLYVGGLTTDYCVRASVLDALERGFEVIVIREAIRAVDLEPGDGERALREMTAAGARVLEGPSTRTG